MDIRYAPPKEEESFIVELSPNELFYLKSILETTIALREKEKPLTMDNLEEALSGADEFSEEFSRMWNRYDGMSP